MFKEHMNPDHTVFYCGGYGDFDAACADTVRLLKSEGANAELCYAKRKMPIHQFS